MTLERSAEKASQENQYKRAPKKTKEKSAEDKEKTKKKNQSKPIIRDRWNPVDESKLNLAPLFAKTPPAYHDRLYAIAARLFRILYGNTSAGKLPDFEYKILDALIEKGKNMEEGETLILQEFLPEDPELREIYYKMIQGTKEFRLKPKAGYPPLENFIRIAKEPKTKPIYFCFASTPLLEAIFGPISKVILEEEKEKGGGKKSVSLKKAELQALLQKQNDPKMKLEQFKELMSHLRTPSPVKEVIVRDPQSTFQQKVLLENASKRSESNKK
jgi:hypothetical protein